ncbi:MAG: GntR family transcriptional regulator [Bacteroidia bacterium]
MQQGAYLVDLEENDVLLPIKYLLPSTQIDDWIRVFVYKDNDGRPIATTLEPYAQIGDFCSLEIKQVNNTGAFLDIGIHKDVLLPFAEQRGQLEEGDHVVVYILIDPKSERLMATQKFNKYLQKADELLERKDEVEILIAEESPMGYKCIVNNQFSGMLFKNELFKEVELGQSDKAYIKYVRPDGKLDLQLQPLGYVQIDRAAQDLLKHIKDEGGFLDLHDKSDPDLIKAKLGISKKAFKKAAGQLYKSKLITIEDKGLKIS